MLTINNLYSDYKKRVILTVCHEKTQETFKNNYLGRASIISIVSGIASVIFKDGSKVELKAGDSFVCDSNLEYTVACLGFVELLSVHFRVSDFIDGYEFKIYDKSDASKLTTLFDGIKKKIVSENVNAKKIQDTILFIEKNLELREKNRTIYSEIVVKSSFTFILSLIFQYFYEYENYKLTDKDLHRAEIEKSLSYINEHLTEKITLDELDKVAMMGKTNYSVAFKRIMGVTVWDYILNARIELATSYILEQESFNISEIAQLCGFNNSTHFNKVFKKVKGKTPSDFKKKPDNPCF